MTVVLQWFCSQGSSAIKRQSKRIPPIQHKLKASHKMQARLFSSAHPHAPAESVYDPAAHKLHAEAPAGTESILSKQAAYTSDLLLRRH